MNNLDELNRLIAAAESELAGLETRRSELLARLAELQREKAAGLHPTATPAPKNGLAVGSHSSQEEKIVPQPVSRARGCVPEAVRERQNGQEGLSAGLSQRVGARRLRKAQDALRRLQPA